MLVLSRRVGEELVIAGSIRVVILPSRNGQVRLGVIAPPDVRVDRQEVHDRRAEFAKTDAEPENQRDPRPTVEVPGK